MTSESYGYGKLIKDRRIELCLTQRQVAEQCRITDSAFAHIERELRLPSKPVADLIADALNLVGEERLKFEAGLQEARDQQSRNRVHKRAEAEKPTMGRKVPDAAEIARDLTDPDLLEGYRNLKKALSKSNQRIAVLSALKAWAAGK